MTNTQLWERRPRAPHGDASPHTIFCAVGLALTLWETIECEISIAYIGLLPGEYRENKYFRTPGFDARYQLVREAIANNANDKDWGGFGDFMDMVLNYSRRRHEIAHGRVYNLGEYGFYLGPTNTLSRNFPAGTATYQYTSGDINSYCEEFGRLAKAAEPFAKQLGRH